MSHSARLRYAAILDDLRGFDEWLISLGVSVQQTDRVHRSISVLEKAEHAFVNGMDGAAAGVSKPEYLFGLTEALELRDVYVAFKNYPSEQLRNRLVRALDGPASPADETQKSRDGRNVMFELALGSEWARSGASIQLLEPDLFVKTPTAEYFVACKRPSNERRIKDAVRSAAGQLRSVLDSSSKASLGVIAISVAHILNRGRMYFPGSYDQLSALVNLLLDSHLSTWQTVDFHSRNIAVLFHAHTPADWGEGLFRVSASIVGPTRRDRPIPQNFRDSVELLYASNSRSSGAI